MDRGATAPGLGALLSHLVLSTINYLLDIASALLLTYCKCMHQVRSEKATLSLRGKDEA